MADHIDLPQGFHLHAGFAAFDASCTQFSPWSNAQFLWNGIKFESTIQFLSWMKARHYEMDEIAAQVLLAQGHKAAIDLTHGIGDPSDQAWNRRAIETVKLAYIQRMLDEPAMIHVLAATHGKRIAFVTANDKWGTGQKEDAANASPVWTGENHLGGLLSSLRDGYFKPLTLLLNPVNYSLSESDIQAVVEQAMFYINKAISFYPSPIQVPEIAFNMKGKMPSKTNFKAGKISFNPVLLLENWDAFMLDVIPHEVAHYVSMSVWGEKIQAHGPEWCAVMKHFAVSPHASYDFDTVNAERNQEGRHIHSCGCGVHLVSAAANEEHRKAPRHCKDCDQEVQHALSESIFLAYANTDAEQIAA